MINPYLSGTKFYASDKGEIWNANHRRLTLKKDPCGYLMVHDVDGTPYFAHEVVWLSFNSKQRNELVMFKDEDKENIALENLWTGRVNDLDLTTTDTYIDDFNRKQFATDDLFRDALAAYRVAQIEKKLGVTDSGAVVIETLRKPREPISMHKPHYFGLICTLLDRYDNDKERVYAHLLTSRVRYDGVTPSMGHIMSAIEYRNKGQFNFEYTKIRIPSEDVYESYVPGKLDLELMKDIPIPKGDLAPKVRKTETQKKKERAKAKAGIKPKVKGGGFRSRLVTAEPVTPTPDE
jgi:hypothetical protein